MGWSTYYYEYLNNSDRGFILLDSKKWQTLVRITKIENEMVEMIIPGWDPHTLVLLPISSFPEALHKALRVSQYLLVKANLNASTQELLSLTDFGLAPEPVPEDEL